VFLGMLLMAWNVWKTIAARTTTADSPVVQPA
jgi:cbb3-type cytochrome oxidase subunit 1